MWCSDGVQSIRGRVRTGARAMGRRYAGRLLCMCLVLVFRSIQFVLLLTLILILTPYPLLGIPTSRGGTDRVHPGNPALLPARPDGGEQRLQGGSLSRRTYIAGGR